jgi:hypothetical protein
MAQEFELYLAIGQQLELSHESQLFGKPCFKINGKPYISFFHNEMVFKLSGEIHKEALSLDGASLFDPSQKKRPMKEWVQLPFDYNQKWKFYAEEALKYVNGIYAQK